ncbi:MAG: glycosyltransferase, partial [Candidatus Sumerlaeia bacterium]|nr:glycosyltransferase [Candidatus Sumerlaeia bacterium]
LQDFIKRNGGFLSLVVEAGRGFGDLDFLSRIDKFGGADFIIEMDADFSHQPRFIPAMLNAAQTADVVIGSRLVTGGGERGRSLIRRWITLLANLYIRLVLGLPIRDCTSGYRVFRREALEKINLEQMTSTGPAIVQEILLACHLQGLRLKEVPIIFEERRAGKSTFNWRIMLQSLGAVLKLRQRKFETQRRRERREYLFF